jgi:hypothetical protein
MIKRNNSYLIPYKGIQTYVPISNGSLDFSGIPSPGREILQGVVDQWIADGNTLDLTTVPEPEPEPTADWQGFLAQFVFPGNETYTMIATPVQQSNNAIAQEHWANLRSLLLSPEFRTRESVIGGWNYLKFLLGKELSQEAIDAFENLATQNQIILPD